MASPRSVAVAIIFASPPASPPRDTAAAHDSHAIAPDKGDEEEGPTFLLVSSRKKKNRYVFPKGGIEHGERSPEAAERESWEEGAPPESLFIAEKPRLTPILCPMSLSRTPTGNRKTLDPSSRLARPLGASRAGAAGHALSARYPP
jgi:hypothetical protein